MKEFYNNKKLKFFLIVLLSLVCLISILFICKIYYENSYIGEAFIARALPLSILFGSSSIALSILVKTEQLNKQYNKNKI